MITDAKIKIIIIYVFSFNSIILCVKNDNCQNIPVKISGAIKSFDEGGNSGIIKIKPLKIILLKNETTNKVNAKRINNITSERLIKWIDSNFFLLFHKFVILGCKAIVNGKIKKEKTLINNSLILE